MNFFKLRRTKMLDEAVLDHKPQSVIMSLLIFYLVFFIGDIIRGIIASIPSVIWMLSYEGFYEATKEYTESIMAGNTDTSQFEEFIYGMIENIPPWLTAVSLIAFVALPIAAIFYCKRFEKRPITSLGIRKKGMFKEYGIGLIIGFLMLDLTLFISFLCGGVSLKVNPNGISPMILLFLLAFIIQGASEEIMFRGYFMMTVARDYKISTAIAVSSILFSLLHSGNNGAGTLPLINIVLFGIFMGIYVFKRGDLWGACAIHTMWNFAQGCIFGSSVSGMKGMPSIFVVDIKENMSLANGGAFGLEGSLAATVVLLACIGLVFFLKTRKGEESLSDATDFE